jgi:hypothetical protein
MPSSTSGVGSRSSAGSEQQWWKCDVPRSLPQEANLAVHFGSLPTDDPQAPPAYPGRPRGRPGHCPITSHDDGQVQTDTPLAHRSLRQLRAPGSDSSRPRAGRGRSGRPRRPRPSQPCGGLPHRRAPRPHFGRTQRTPERTDTGRRTPDAGHRTPGRSDARTGHWTPVAWTGTRGHWTPDAGRGHRQGNEGTAGSRTSWVTTPSDRAGTPNRVPVDGACGARQPMQARR